MTLRSTILHTRPTSFWPLDEGRNYNQDVEWGMRLFNPPEWNIHPQPGPGVITLGGSISRTAFCGAIGHVALWNRLLTADEVASMFMAGQAELAAGASCWQQISVGIA